VIRTIASANAPAKSAGATGAPSKDSTPISN
jgi:hypothetical protein